jgi:hypothetical protein
MEPHTHGQSLWTDIEIFHPHTKHSGTRFTAMGRNLTTMRKEVGTVSSPEEVENVPIGIIPAPYQVRGRLQQECSFFRVPGRVSLARNDNSIFSAP